MAAGTVCVHDRSDGGLGAHGRSESRREHEFYRCAYFDISIRFTNTNPTDTDISKPFGT